MGCCESMSKLLLIIFNTLFFIIGAVVLGVGIWVKVDKSNLFEMMRKIKLEDTAASFNNTSNSVLDILAIVLIVMGAFTFITGFCGCCGAIKESQCLLYMYSFLVTVVVLVEVGIGIYAGVKQNEFQSTLKSSLTTVLKNEFNGVTGSNSTLFSKIFTAIMIEMKCCGVNNETDFSNTKLNWKYLNSQARPIGCCALKGDFKYNANDNFNYENFQKEMKNQNCPTTSKISNDDLNQEGCFQTLIDLIKKNLAIVIGVCVGLGLFEIFCIVFACCVARKDE